MYVKGSRVIFHIDVNSAYLSWEAVHRLEKGEIVDYRMIPAVVGGDPEKRHGIVLAKSIPAKKYGIITGESLCAARAKCQDLMVLPPSYGIYVKYSLQMMDMLRNYSPIIQRYSVDECFLDYTGMERFFGDPVDAANNIRKKIFNELGFTVNIGISSNKILAKMASDLEKPDKVHTIWPEEIREKMWPLPVGDLFMVGQRTEKKLTGWGVKTIGDLAAYDRDLLKVLLKKYGCMIHDYAWGIESSPVRVGEGLPVKSIGNSTTTPQDVKDMHTASMYLLSLCECVASRLRSARKYCRCISISVRYGDFLNQSRQCRLDYATNGTVDIHNKSLELFKDLWNGQPVRHIGVSVSDLSEGDVYQLGLLSYQRVLKYGNLDAAIDRLRDRYGKNSIYRACFLGSAIRPVTGGVSDGEYPLMSPFS